MRRRLYLKQGEGCDDGLMIVYCYQCPNKKCGKIVELTREIKERNLPVECSCGVTMDRLFTPPMISSISYDHYDPTLDVTLRGPAHRRDVMKRMGLEEFNTDTTSDIGKHKAEIRYITKHAKSKKEANRAIRREGYKAQQKRKRKIVKENLAKVNLSRNKITVH